MATETLSRSDRLELADDMLRLLEERGAFDTSALEKEIETLKEVILELLPAPTGTAVFDLASIYSATCTRQNRCIVCVASDKHRPVFGR